MVNYRFWGKFLIFCQDVLILLCPANSGVGSSGDVLEPSVALNVQLLERENPPCPSLKSK